MMNFYRNLMRSKANSLKHIDIEAMKEGHQFTIDQGKILTAKVFDEEIVKALQGIGGLKSPRIDGYRAKFFKAS
ncbi:unnamed protein product [Lathyrus sativus]|nr:unnamed protein product [Lathyrus sativus]